MRALLRSVSSSFLATISMLWPFDRVLDALEALGGVVGRKRADEDGHLAAIGQELDDLLAEGLAGLEVVGADVEQPIGFGAVGVEADDVGFSRRVLMLPTWSLGAMTLTAMPLYPWLTRFSRIWFCSSALPFGGILMSTWTSASFSYLCTPAAAIFQNSLALLVTKASFRLLRIRRLEDLNRGLLAGRRLSRCRG